MNFYPSSQPKFIKNRSSSFHQSHPSSIQHISFCHEQSPTVQLEDKSRKQLRQFMEQNELLKGRIDVANSSIEHLNQRLRKKDEEINRLASNLETKSKDSFEARQLSDELARKNKMYKKQVKEQEVTLKELRQQLKTERDLRIGLQSQKNDILEKLQSLQLSAEALHEHILTDKIDKIEKKHRQDVGLLNQNIDSLKLQMQKSQKHIQQLEELKNKQSSSLAEQTEQIRILNENIVRCQQAAKLSERLRLEKEQSLIGLKQIELSYSNLVKKHEQMTRNYEKLLQQHTETLNRNKNLQDLVRQLKSRLRTLEEQQKSLFMEDDHNRCANECGKAANSYLMDDGRSVSNHASSVSLHQFNSINIHSSMSKKQLRQKVADCRERIDVIRSQQNENILMTEHYIPTNEGSRVDEGRKAGGIRSRYKRNDSHRSSQDNTSPLTRKQSQVSHEEERGLLNSNSKVFQELINRYEEIKSRKREKIL